MKMYYVQITNEKGESGGGIAGPSKSFEDILTFTPDEEYHGKLIQLMEAHDDQESTPIFKWDWEIGDWFPEEKQFVIQFGANAPLLKIQLANQGFDENQLASWQKDAEAIQRLFSKGLFLYLRFLSSMNMIGGKGTKIYDLQQGYQDLMKTNPSREDLVAFCEKNIGTTISEPAKGGEGTK